MTMPGPCVLCGATNYALSMGGPTICPSCDCGQTSPGAAQYQFMINGRQRIEMGRLQEESERLREALEAIAGFGDVDLSGEWPGQLRDIIRSMTDCAKRALA